MNALVEVQVKRKRPQVKLVFLVLSGSILCWSLFHFHIINLKNLQRAFIEHFGLVVIVFILQFLILLLSSLRYHVFLQLFGVSTTRLKVIAANAIGQGAGQWLPSSMAFIEILRIGVLVGHSEQINHRSKILRDIAAAAFFDRAFAQILMQILGGIAALYFVSRQLNADHSSVTIVTIASFAIIGGVFFLVSLIFLPKITQALLKKLVIVLPERVSTRPFFQVNIEKARKSLEHFQQAFVKSKRKKIASSVVLSSAVFLLSCLSFYICGIITEHEVSILSLASVIPLLMISALLPLSFGGFGGQQVFAMGLFTFFGEKPESGAVITFFAAALYLIVNSLLALPFLPLVVSPQYRRREG